MQIEGLERREYERRGRLRAIAGPECRDQQEEGPLRPVAVPWRAIVIGLFGGLLPWVLAYLWLAVFP